MSKRKLIIGGILAASLSAMAVTAVIAGEEGGYRCDKMERAGFGGPGMGMEGPGKHMLRGLDLTDEQEAKIKDIMRGQQAAMKEKMKVLRTSHDELHAATFVKTLDAKKVRELADAQAKTMADLAVARAEAMNKVYNLLTPEQQKKLAEKREERGGRF